MLTDMLRESIVNELSFVPTPQQAEAAGLLATFLLTTRDDVFVLRGYAGTGKTSLVAALVRTLVRLKRPVVLMAPTGRAAKVFSAYSGHPTYTIHKVIYRQKRFNGEETEYSLGFNKYRHALFVIDEASMITAAQGETGSLFSGRCLLEDLFHFVGQGDGCRMLFVGDTAQLPPVGEEYSPALTDTTFSDYGLRSVSYTLTQVVRQAVESGVLWNATALRMLMADGMFVARPRIKIAGFQDVRFLSGNDLIETLENAYSRTGMEGTIVITRSNKRAIVYNNGIRTRIFDREGELVKGERVMVVRNNYYWTSRLLAGSEEKNIPMDFIANGDVAEVRHVRNVHEVYGFRFADVVLSFPDYEDFELEARVLLDTLQSEAPALTREQSETLYQSVLADYTDVYPKKERMKRLRDDPYYNALQLKYAYAVTCHKAQGGQWENVFLDQGYLSDEMYDRTYLRWLYTALTRTTGTLYLINWPEVLRMPEKNREDEQATEN